MISRLRIVGNREQFYLFMQNPSDFSGIYHDLSQRRSACAGYAVSREIVLWLTL
jgi:hypothetical protein